MKKIILRAGLAAGLSMVSATGWASCDSILFSYESYVSSGNSSGAADILSEYPHCFGGGQSTSGTVIRSTAFFQAAAISNALGQRQTGDGPALAASTNTRGMAAGGSAGKWNFWGNLGLNNTRQSYTTLTGFTAKNRMDVATTVFGADYGLSPTTVFGVSGAFDDGDGSGKNTFPGVVTTPNEVKGYMVAPYFGMQLTKALAFDLSAGFGRGELDTPTTESNASRWFAGANLSYSRWFDNIQLTGKASYLHAVEDYGDIKNSTTGAKFVGTDAKNTLGQIKLAGQVGYWMNGVMPVASLAYMNDVRRKTTQFGSPGNPIGRDGWLLGIGMNFYSIKDGVSGGVVYNRELGRNHQNLESLMANINIRF